MTEEPMEAAERTVMDPAVIASAASVALSWYYFFGRGDRLRGIFVGLWPPTILAFASYFKQTETNEMIEKVTRGSGIMDQINDQVDRMLRQR